MARFRILHVSDSPVMRESVKVSLSPDPEFIVIGCGSEDDVLALATDFVPDVILCDATMPNVDGLVLLERLRGSSDAAKIPVILTTASDDPDEAERLMSLGAMAVIVMPLDRRKFAEAVRSHRHFARFAAADDNFARRLHADAVALTLFRKTLRFGTEPSAGSEELLSCVHKLAGAAGVFGFRTVSIMASALEETIIEQRAGRGLAGGVEARLDALLACMAHIEERAEAADWRSALVGRRVMT